jgi:hypothetical protein
MGYPAYVCDALLFDNWHVPLLQLRYQVEQCTGSTRNGSATFSVSAGNAKIAVSAAPIEEKKRAAYNGAEFCIAIDWGTAKTRRYARHIAGVLLASGARAVGYSMQCLDVFLFEEFQLASCRSDINEHLSVRDEPLIGLHESTYSIGQLRKAEIHIMSGLAFDERERKSHGFIATAFSSMVRRHLSDHQKEIKDDLAKIILRAGGRRLSIVDHASSL